MNEVEKEINSESLMMDTEINQSNIIKSSSDENSQIKSILLKSINNEK